MSDSDELMDTPEECLYSLHSWKTHLHDLMESFSIDNELYEKHPSAIVWWRERIEQLVESPSFWLTRVDFHPMTQTLILEVEITSC